MAGSVKREATPIGARGNRTRLIRAAIIDAARDLFVERGYAATTMQAISEASGIPPATVYRLMSSKLEILKALLDIAPGGDDEPIAFADRPSARAISETDDPYEQVRRFASLTADVMSRVAPIHAILLGAAGADPDAATLLKNSIRQRQAGQGRLARLITRSAAARPGVTERTAADIVHALASPELYQLLTADRGWATQRYAAWLTATLTTQLLTNRQETEPPTRRRTRGA
jgi:AcrR family transcriptional regulator